MLAERWRRKYNQRRPHSALAYRPPAPEARLPRSQARDPIPWKWTSKGPKSNLKGGTTRGGRSRQEKERSMTKEEMIENLNEDLAGELGAIIQYLTYAAKATGPLQAAAGTVFSWRSGR